MVVSTLLDPVSLTGAHIRAARGLLNWSQRTLALKAGVNKATITTLERGERIHCTVMTISKVTGALQSAGILFLNHPTPGVMLNHNKPNAGSAL